MLVTRSTMKSMTYCQLWTPAFCILPEQSTTNAMSISHAATWVTIQHTCYLYNTRINSLLVLYLLTMLQKMCLHRSVYLLMIVWYIVKSGLHLTATSCRKILIHSSSGVKHGGWYLTLRSAILSPPLTLQKTRSTTSTRWITSLSTPLTHVSI